jgi:ABC-type uncharacterized transport system permease subunit
MISFIALAVYLTMLVVVMYQSVIEVDNHPLALLQAIVMVVIVAGIPALLGMLNGMNYERKHGKEKFSKSDKV